MATWHGGCLANKSLHPPCPLLPCTHCRSSASATGPIFPHHTTCLQPLTATSLNTLIPAATQRRPSPFRLCSLRWSSVTSSLAYQVRLCCQSCKGSDPELSNCSVDGKGDSGYSGFHHAVRIRKQRHFVYISNAQMWPQARWLAERHSDPALTTRGGVCSTGSVQTSAQTILKWFHA